MNVCVCIYVYIYAMACLTSLFCTECEVLIKLYFNFNCEQAL
jgi:hypothetical protein